jgi:hypothetical protein
MSDSKTTKQKLEEFRDYLLDKGNAQDVVVMATIVALLNILVDEPEKAS